MKKLLIVFILFILVGCSSNNDTSYVTSLKDGNNTVISGDITITKDEIYQELLSNLGSSIIVTDALDFVATQEITDEKAIQAYIDDRIKTIEENSSKKIKEYAKGLGYDSADQYIEEAIRPDAKQSLLTKKYVEENFDKIIETYQVTYLKVMLVDSESIALELIKQATDEKAFDKLMSDNNGSDYGLIYNKDTLVDENIINSLDAFKEDGTYSKAIRTSDEKYAVIYVYNTDKEAKKEDIISDMSVKSEIQGDCQSFYLKKYNFNVLEPKIKDEISKLNENYFG